MDSPRLIAYNIVVSANAWTNRRWLLHKHFTCEEYIKQQNEFILQAIYRQDSGPVDESSE